MRQGLLQVWFLLIGIGLVTPVAAQDDASEGRMPAFKFQLNDSLLNPQLSSTLHSPNEVKATHRSTPAEAKFRSYDAIFYYPLHRQGVSIDLGLNLRLQEEQSAQTVPLHAYDRDWLSIDPYETKTMVHAAAVFDLPFKGFKAGLSGTYNPDLALSEYDYRAKLSYQWKNGLGLEGGWQHQQKSEQALNFNDTLDVQTLFLDMKYRF